MTHLGYQLFQATYQRSFTLKAVTETKMKQDQLKSAVLFSVVSYFIPSKVYDVQTISMSRRMQPQSLCI